ncbi:MAG: hypothetical protein AAFN65_08110, partial [Bacteroidota bacterium]
MNQAFYTWLDFQECAVVLYVDDLTFYRTSFFNFGGKNLPWVSLCLTLMRTRSVSALVSSSYSHTH